MQEILISRTEKSLVNKAQLIAALNSLKVGNHYRVIIKDARTRSLPQNAYYWGVIVPIIRRALYEEGYDEIATDMDAHDFLKAMFLSKRVVSKKSGHTVDMPGRSSKLTIPEFNDYIERICRWAAIDLSVVIPAPNEPLLQLAEYAEQMEYSIEEPEYEAE